MDPQATKSAGILLSDVASSTYAKLKNEVLTNPEDQ